MPEQRSAPRGQDGPLSETFVVYDGVDAELGFDHGQARAVVTGHLVVVVENLETGTANVFDNDVAVWNAQPFTTEAEKEEVYTKAVAYCLDREYFEVEEAGAEDDE